MLAQQHSLPLKEQHSLLGLVISCSRYFRTQLVCSSSILGGTGSEGPLVDASRAIATIIAIVAITGFTFPNTVSANTYFQAGGITTFKATDGGYSCWTGGTGNSNYCGFDQTGLTESASVGVRNAIPLGTSLSGIPTELRLSMSEDSGFAIDESTRKFYAYLAEYNTNATSSPTGNWMRFSYRLDANNIQQFKTASSTAYGGTWTSSTQLDQSKYYFIIFNSTNSQVGRLWGANSGSYDICYSTGFTCVNKRVYYSLYTTTSLEDTSYVTSLTPNQGSTTPSTTVPLTMTYHAYSGNDITSYAFTIKDTLIATSSILVTGGAYTGDNSVTDSVTLTSGHIYTVTAYICNDDGTCFSGLPGNQFSVITDYNTLYSQTFNAYGGLLASTTQPCIAPSSILDVGGGLTYAFCTMFIPSNNVLNQYANIPTILASRFPFNYIDGLQDIFTSIESSSGSSTPTVTFDLPNRQDIEFLNPTHVLASSTIVSTSRTYLGYFMYLMVGLLAFRGVAKLL